MAEQKQNEVAAQEIGAPMEMERGGRLVGAGRWPIRFQENPIRRRRRRTTVTTAPRTSAYESETRKKKNRCHCD